MKSIDRARNHSKQEQVYNKVMKEVRLMAGLDAPNVVKLHRVQKTQNNYHLIMELCNGGDLQKFIRARGGYLSETEAKFFLR